MLFNVEEDLNLCKELKLTPKQLMFVKILYRNPGLDDKNWKLKSYEMSLKFQDVSPLQPRELEDLLERDIIIDLNDSKGKIYYDCFELNPKYTKHFSLKVIKWVSEISDIYPRFIYDETGKRYNAITASDDEIAEIYMKAINKDRKMHEEIMSLVKFGVENNLIKIGIDKFVKTKHWLSLRLLKNESKNVVNESKLG